MILEVQNLDLFYGDAQALSDVSLAVEEGAIVAIVGANGAGKSSLIRTIAGIERPRRGSIRYRGKEIAGSKSSVVCNLGIGQVAEGRQIFPNLTVAENLEVGALVPRGRPHMKESFARVYDMFPRLEERHGQYAGTLSGGEQQMLAIARALMSRPRLLLLDEPSLGLAPIIVRQIFAAIRDLNRKQGLTVFLVEQNAYHALKLAHRGYVMVNGAIAMTGTGAELLAREDVRAAYLEGGHG